MIIAIDIETAGLDATKFLYACILKEKTKKPEFFKSKQALWKRVLELAEAESKRGKTLTIYSHNAQYDTAGYVDLKDKRMHYFCNRPFIWALKENGKEIIKFLDTMNIYGMSLKKVGEIIGQEKLEIPKELLNENTKITKELEKEIQPYVLRDCEITLNSIKKIKQKLKEEGINTKRIMTKNQIAINYMMNKLQKLPENKTDHIFWNRKTGETRRTFRAEKIHSAYRGGRAEAFQTGIFEKATAIDFNNLYPYAETIIKFPDLRTERITYKPKEENLQKIGITKCAIKNEEDELGILQIRTPTFGHYLRKGQTGIGIWTHDEINEALKNGHKLLKMEWNITYDEAYNPFKEIIPEIYKRRKEGSEFNNYFYKMIMNSSLGKMAQRKPQTEMKIISVEETQKYLKEKWEQVMGIGKRYMIKKKMEMERKNYYLPIVPCLTNAIARIIMYRQYKKIPKEDILYTDTDSITMSATGYTTTTIQDIQTSLLSPAQQTVYMYNATDGNTLKINVFQGNGSLIENIEITNNHTQTPAYNNPFTDNIYQYIGGKVNSRTINVNINDSDMRHITYSGDITITTSALTHNITMTANRLTLTFSQNGAPKNIYGSWVEEGNVELDTSQSTGVWWNWILKTKEEGAEIKTEHLIWGLPIAIWALITIKVNGTIGTLCGIATIILIMMAKGIIKIPKTKHLNTLTLSDNVGEGNDNNSKNLQSKPFSESNNNTKNNQ